MKMKPSPGSFKNPGWVRPDDWPFEMDWGSPVWEEEMNRIHHDMCERLHLPGFLWCSQCGTRHTSKTVRCRGCGHRLEIR